MKNKKDNPDKVVIKSKKGIWLRFIKLFPKCRFPWVWLAAYVALEIWGINVGLDSTGYTADLFAGDTSAGLLFMLIFTIVLNLLISNALIFVRQVTSARINRNMRGIVFNKVLRLPMSYFKDENPRDAVYRIVQNSTAMDSTVIFFIIPVCMAVYKSFAVFGRVFSHDWRLSIILLAFIPIQFFTAFIFGRLNYFFNERTAAIKASLTGKLAELVTNIPLAKAFAKEKKETEKGEELTERLYKVSIKSSWLDQVRDLANTFTDILQSVIMILVGVVLLRNAEISTRSWIQFFMFSSTFTGAVTEFMMYWNNIKIIQGGAEKLAEIMNAPEEDGKGLPCENLNGDIVLSDVRFGYDEEQPVLKGVSCTFKDNSVTALLGLSGCGKTTLVNLITRLYIPQSGSITAGGNEVTSFALDGYRSQFVMVSQNDMLFSGTVKENVCYGNENVSEEAFFEALKQAGAYDFVMEMPEKENTLLEEYGNNISGGQRQRLSVARALLSNAHYLILDEPVSAMDAIATAEMLKIFKNISYGRCVIIIAHTPAVLPISENAVVIEDGRVSGEGSVEDMKKTSGFLREFAGKKVSE